MRSSIRVAIDIGGTFTDIVVMSGDGTLHENKVSTTPDDPSCAVVIGLSALLAELGLAPASVAEVLHGTTAVPTRHEGLGFIPRQIEHVGHADAPDLQHVAEAARGDDSCPRTRPLQKGVGADGRRVPHQQLP